MRLGRAARRCWRWGGPAARRPAWPAAGRRSAPRWARALGPRRSERRSSPCWGASARLPQLVISPLPPELSSVLFSLAAAAASLEVAGRVGGGEQVSLRAVGSSPGSPAAPGPGGLAALPWARPVGAAAEPGRCRVRQREHGRGRGAVWRRRAGRSGPVPRIHRPAAWGRAGGGDGSGEAPGCAELRRREGAGPPARWRERGEPRRRPGRGRAWRAPGGPPRAAGGLAFCSAGRGRERAGGGRRDGPSPPRPAGARPPAPAVRRSGRRG